MKQQTDQEDLIVRYFFDELSEEEQEQIEMRFLNDNLFFEQMLSVEDALIDAYVQGQLSERESEKVEKFLLFSPKRIREADFVRELIDDLARSKSANANNDASVPEKRPSRWRSLLALLGIENSSLRFSFALIPVLVLSLALAIWNLMLQKRLTRIKAEQIAMGKRTEELQKDMAAQAERNERLEQDIQKERGERERLEQQMAFIRESQTLTPPNDILTVSLKVDSLARGGGELQVIRIASSKRLLRLQIDIDRESDYKNYSAVINTFDGREIWSRDNVRFQSPASGRTALTIPARLFASNDYTLTIRGRTENGDVFDIGNYSFRVKK